MGGVPYAYTVPYESDLGAVLEALRQREFAAGRYFPAIDDLLEMITPPEGGGPGAQHASIEAAIEASQETGTRSILDIFHISDVPDFCAAAPFEDEELVELFGTAQPSREVVEASNELYEHVDRGHCRYVLLYEDGRPTEVHFLGYSFD